MLRETGSLLRNRQTRYPGCEEQVKANLPSIKDPSFYQAGCGTLQQQVVGAS